MAVDEGLIGTEVVPFGAARGMGHWPKEKLDRKILTEFIELGEFVP